MCMRTSPYKYLTCYYISNLFLSLPHACYLEFHYVYRIRSTGHGLRADTFITETFHSMANNARKSLRSKFIIPKAPITCTPRLDEVYTDSCSKGTNKWTGPWHMYWHWRLTWLAQFRRSLTSIIWLQKAVQRRSLLEAAPRHLKLMEDINTRNWSPTLWTRKNTWQLKPQCCSEMSSWRML